MHRHLNTGAMLARNGALLVAEALLVVAMYVAYSALRTVVEGSEGDAVEHALRIIAIEQSLGMFHEAEIQQFVARHGWLEAAMKFVYLWVYMPFIIAAGFVLYAHDRALYRSYRNAFFLSAGVGLVIFAMLPVAPPRMLHEYGFTDPLHTTATATSVLKNDFAAVPSFHFGFTLLAALGISHAFGFRRWMVALIAVVPVVMLLSIVATANHFFLDAAAGTVVVMAAWWVAVPHRESAHTPMRLARAFR